MKRLIIEVMHTGVFAYIRSRQVRFFVRCADLRLPNAFVWESGQWIGKWYTQSIGAKDMYYDYYFFQFTSRTILSLCQIYPTNNIGNQQHITLFYMGSARWKSSLFILAGPCESQSHTMCSSPRQIFILMTTVKTRLLMIRMTDLVKIANGQRNANVDGGKSKFDFYLITPSSFDVIR